MTGLERQPKHGMQEVVGSSPIGSTPLTHKADQKKYKEALQPEATTCSLRGDRVGLEVPRLARAERNGIRRGLVEDFRGDAALEKLHLGQ